ncbi:MAG TPA: VCBS repeat-containing protein, partial [Pirellulales bacterium]|nr:VCBS repeat-containing protein [Pirellulales bacterium]
MNALKRGVSWSGREPNRCFLNLGNSKFSDISGVSGLDSEGDGRAAAIVDWDRDGDLDIWLTNRTAPRLSLLRNNIGQEN